MSHLCLCFEVHQPTRLRPYSVFDSDGHYFNHTLNRDILLRVAKNCYKPAFGSLLRSVRKHQGQFRFALSITGQTLCAFKRHCPEVILLLQELSQTRCVEFLAETYHHSLASLYCQHEFRAQVDLQMAIIDELFDQQPTVFRNTELIYSDAIAQTVNQWGLFKGILLEGTQTLLEKQSANYIYHSPAADNLKLLPRNFQLSDDLAFRFTHAHGKGKPLTAKSFASKIDRVAKKTQIVNVYIDFETFGEHHGRATGIHTLLDELPQQVLDRPGLSFITPAQAMANLPTAGPLHVPSPISWADTQRDLSAWLGNPMQANAMSRLFEIKPLVAQTHDISLMHTWRLLSTSDHFYYMSTKCYNDGQVQA